MKTKIICGAIVVIGLMCFSSPVRSLIGCRETFSMDKATDPLPDGVVAVEYLESTGTQYINLPFGFDPSDEIDMYAGLLVTGQDKYLVSPIRWNDNNNRFALAGTSIDLSFGVGFGQQGTNNTLLYPKTKADYTIHHWTYANRIFKVTDLLLSCDVTSITFGKTTANLRLFFGYNANTKGRIRSYRHKKNGKDLINLVAVRYVQDGQDIGCMFDLVTKEMFYNSGTGSFLIGPDKE